MVWRRKERDMSPCYTRLVEENGCKKKVPKGYVPVIVGNDNMAGEEERFLVHVKMLKEPCITALLEQAAEQFGYQSGVLRVLCDAHFFQHTIDLLSHGR
ncbi:SAUR-like auxin-responsive protein family [Rhynchospora pubera]|uniref:SAUR-like auxin-responsive protein family n=1 Tax=Rhynchospora pubera TaxID=906938 RepID=A0AAV8GL02_9POAL|nr:SAUR-like auxin-responsive protein family [Rhynchospora pubera]